MPTGTLPTPASSRPTQSPVTLPLNPTPLHLLTTLLSQAAFSSRFASLVSPIPCPEHFVDPATSEIHIHALREALSELPSTPSGLFNIPLPPPAAALLADLRLRASALANATGARTGVSGARLRRYAVRGGGESGGAGRFLAFHGSAVQHWWGILHRELEVTPDDPATVETGRAYGQGVYCAEKFDVAASFAPGVIGRPEPPGWGGVDSVVGVFEVVEDQDGVVVRRHANDKSLPEGYVVVSDAAYIKLVELVVSVPPLRKRRGRAGSGTEGSDGGGMRGMLGGCSWVVVLILAYAIGLVAIGTDVSKIGRLLWRVVRVLLGRRI